MTVAVQADALRESALESGRQEKQKLLNVDEECAAEEAPQEIKDVPAKDEDAGSPIWYAAKTVVLATVNILISSVLIDFNKYMMTPEHFPFALPLVFVHTTMGAVLAGLLFLVCPWMFPSLVDEEKKVPIDRELILKGVLPVAVCTAGCFVLSNLAYLFSSVAFLQMMKEANIVLVYVLALAAGLERYTNVNVFVLLLFVGATTLTVEGEVHFSLIGFCVQGASQICECVKVTLQALLLSGGNGKKLDPLAYLLVVMPWCALMLGSALTYLYVAGGEDLVALPTAEDVYQNLHLLVASGLIAFSLNLVVATFVRHTSGVAVILVGIPKDAFIVFANVLFLGESISGMQTFGFLLQLAFVTLYSVMKTWKK